ncbi:unnamed protein product [Schistosoma curassoni]|nr:unnamed protein product [Schistosoma curassoni]
MIISNNNELAIALDMQNNRCLSFCSSAVRDRPQSVVPIIDNNLLFNNTEIDLQYSDNKNKQKFNKNSSTLNGN